MFDFYTGNENQKKGKYDTVLTKYCTRNIMLINSITEFCCEDKDKWNEVVKSFGNYDVFYLNEYVTAFREQDKINGDPVLILYENKDDRAINVVFKRDISLHPNFEGKIESGKYYDLISPYGYGGFWGTVNDYEKLNECYNEYCISKGYICEFVRFELFSDYRMHYDGTSVTVLHNVVRELESSMDDMWMNFKAKVRKNVKKAISNDLQIIIENDGTHLDDFLEIYYSTMDRNNAQDMYYFSRSFFEKINEMKENIAYFYVLKDDKVISAELVIYGSEMCYSYLGGTNQDYFDLRPNDFIKYKIIEWAKGKKIKKFVLGGGYGKDDGIYQYKICLAPEGSVDFYVGKKIFDKVGYEYLVDICAKVNPECRNTEFFPQYRVR